MSLPSNEDGDIITSAEFGQWTPVEGEHLLVEIIYNTGPDGAWVDEDDYSNRTLHGPFVSIEEAQSWMEAYPDGDTEIKDMETTKIRVAHAQKDVPYVNAVRPKEDA